MKKLLNKPAIRAISNIINKILNINHVCAIRKNTNKPVRLRNNKDTLKKDIQYLKENYKSLAIITKNEESAKRLYEELKKDFQLSYLDIHSEDFIKDFVILPAYLAKGLEFDAVMIYQDKENYFTKEEKKLYYVAVTRAQHELYVYE